MKRIQQCLLFAWAIVFFAQPCYAQFPVPPMPPHLPLPNGPALPEVKRHLDQVGNLFRPGVFPSSTRRTSTEFGKTVIVINSSNMNSSRTSGDATEAKIKRGQIVDMNWEPIAYFDNQLFPSTIISMATYKGQIGGELSAIKSSALGFRLQGKNSNVQLKWEIECADKRFFDKIDGTYTYGNAGQEYYLMPDIPWNYEALAKQETSRPVSVYYRLYDERGKKVEKLVSLTMRSINDCVWHYKDIDLQFMFAAYVNEEHPEIDNILREGLQTGMVKAWVGYQWGEREVKKQVTAIWRVLHDRGFAYSNVTETIGDEGNLVSQSVRSFDKALKTSQANCVDGTVVFASILKKIGISPVLVLVPGHCFLGYYVDKKKTKIEYLETTMLSSSQYLVKAKSPKQTLDAYESEFTAATRRAQEEFRSNVAQARAQVTLIDVSNERKKVKPIPIFN